MVSEVEPVIDEENPEDGFELADDASSSSDDDDGPSAWLNERELAAGGDWRETPKRKLYWLNVEQLTEYERMNDRFDTDEEFWDWFDSFAKAAGLKPTKSEDKRDRRDRGSVKSEHWDWGWNKTQDYDSGGYLRQQWSSWGYSSASSDLTRRLAVALGAINTTVQAIRTKPGRYRVKLAADDSPLAPTSYTSFDDDLVVVSPQPLKDASLEEQRGIEITTGWALHEASHTEYTEDVYKEILMPYVLRPAAISGMLMNVLEDVRIERLTAEQYPGFAPYFGWSLEYLWKITGKDAEGHSVPRKGEWTGQNLNDKLNWVIRAIRWPTDFEPIVQDAVDTGKDPDAINEFGWWRLWLTDYDEGRVGARQSIIEALARLAQDPDTESEMKQQAQAEADQEKAEGAALDSLTGDAAREMIKKLIEGLSKGGSIIAACPSPAKGGNSVVPSQQQDKSTTLTAAQAQEIEKLIAEELEIEKPPPWYADSWHGTVPRNVVRKPLETDDSRLRYQRRLDPLLQRLRGAFVFRPVAPEYSNRLLKSGTLDDEELYRWKMGDYRVFEQRVIESKPDTDITLLIDQSGSMAGPKLELAVRLVDLVRMVIATTNGTSLRVRSHTNGIDGHDTSIFRIWEQGDPESRMGLPQAMQHGANNDGFALGWCVDELINLGRPGNQKILLIFSDGIPAGYGYSGQPAMEHVRRVVDAAEKKGVTVIQVAVGVFSEADQATMYKHYAIYENDQKLPTQLTRILSKLL